MGGKPNLPDRYEPTRLLGEGGAGRVWLCHDTQAWNRPVAVKILAVGGDEAEFRKEFATLATLTHPNIPEIYSFGETDSGTCFFSLEYVDGLTFVDSVQDEGFEVFAGLAVEALKALWFIHDFGLVHRDLKPNNLLVRRRSRNGCRVVMLDFGLAESRRESRGETAGTLQYMAPELFEGATPGIKSDLYALGVVFLEALLGRPLVREDPSVDLAAFLQAVKVPADAESLPADIPGGLSTWLNTLRSYEPDERPSDAREALAQLRTVLGSSITIETEATRAARVASGLPPGRSTELEAIQSALQDSETTAVFLTGEAGSGKTRLLNVIRANAIRNRWKVETLANLSPDFQRRLDLQQNVRGDRTRLVLIDDLETASPETGILLDRLIRSPDRTVKILACGRAEEISDININALLSDIDFIPSATQVVLDPLDRAGVSEVLERAIGGEPSDARIRQVLASTSGLAAAVEAVVVSDDDKVSGRLDRLKESVRARLSTLSGSAKTCAISLAILGEPTSVELMRRILAATEATLLSSLDELRAAKLVRELDNRWVAQSRLITELILDLTDHKILTKVTERAIRAVELESDVARESKLARLWRQLGDQDRAVQFAIRAAEGAVADESYRAAMHWYRQAILDLPRHDSRYAHLRLEHAKASELAGDYRSAAKGHAAVARASKDDSTTAESLIRGSRSLLKAGLPKIALRVAHTARAVAVNQRQELLADWQLGAAYVLSGEPRRAYELLNSLPSKIDSLGETPWAAEAFYQLSVALEKQRRFSAASDAYRESARYASEHGCEEALINTLISHAKMEHARAAPHSALKHLERAQELATRDGMERQAMWIMANKARVMQFMGLYDQALECYEEVKTRSQLLGNRDQYFTAQGVLAEILIKLGRPAQATERLQDTLNMSLGEPLKTYIILTLSEAMLEESEPRESKIEELLRRVEREKARSPLIDWGQIVVSLEFHARFDTEPPQELWKRFQDSLDQEGLDQQLVARGWLAWSKEKIRCRDWNAALEACAKALEALDGRHHDIAAQVYLSMSKANKIRADRTRSSIALERGREELQKAADLIEDEELRNDFLARPLFRELREKRETFADAEERLGGLYDMVQALNTGGDPEDQLGVILDQALRVVRAERGLILLRSEGDDEYQVRFSRNLEPQTIEEAAQFSRSAVLTAGRGESVLAINAANDERVRQMKSVSAYGIQSLLCVPLRVRDELVGAVYADTRTDGALFKQQDLQFLEAFADHAALALENARDLRRLEQRRSQLLSATESRESFGAIVGRSVEMQKVYGLIERVAESHLPVLIQGASGTGKELVAREIFARGSRKNKPFLSENCAAIAESLLESELFGHVKGAFTGADRDRDGLFVQADGGTLFLDEVGDMSPAMQARMLRVLQDGELRRVGADTSRHVDVRLITATHRDLSQRVAEGKFREDLLYRLQVLVIQLPPLKDRPTDIELLVRHFLGRIAAQRQQKKVAIRTDAMELLERYAWPGNVRQLENTLQRLALLAGGDAINRATIEQDPSLQASLIGERGKPTLSLKQNERDRIAEALERAGGNRADAAKLLGVSRATIFRKIKRYGLS